MSAEARPAGTVVVIRDGDEQLEVLLLERNRSGAPWVFPGGRVEDADLPGPTASALEGARHAAVREAREEANLELAPCELAPISRWITPEIVSERFDAWFFLARVERSAKVRVDGTEMRSHRWFVPRAALEARNRGEIRLAPPTFVTVSWLTAHVRAEEACRSLAGASLLTFQPRICSVREVACILYPGDAGYRDGDGERPGFRHRLWMPPGGWRYERSESLVGSAGRPTSSLLAKGRGDPGQRL